MRRMNTRAAMPLLFALLLAACGGGGDDGEELRCIGGIVYGSDGTPKSAPASGSVARVLTC